jgi:hypothetical protein
MKSPFFLLSHCFRHSDLIVPHFRSVSHFDCIRGPARFTELTREKRGLCGICSRSTFFQTNCHWHVRGRLNSKKELACAARMHVCCVAFRLPNELRLLASAASRVSFDEHRREERHCWHRRNALQITHTQSRKKSKNITAAIHSNH